MAANLSLSVSVIVLFFLTIDNVHFDQNGRAILCGDSAIPHIWNTAMDTE